jgi:hypothetical protein
MKSGKWTIRISDGFCNYEYELKATNPDVSIYDVVKLVAKKLKAELKEGNLINERPAKVH